MDRRFLSIPALCFTTLQSPFLIVTFAVASASAGVAMAGSAFEALRGRAPPGPGSIFDSGGGFLSLDPDLLLVSPAPLGAEVAGFDSSGATESEAGVS